MRALEKGFLKITSMGSTRVAVSVKEVLTPLLILVADQPHQLTRRVESEWPRTPSQLQSGLFGSSVALAIVAVIAARNEIFPR